MSNLSWRYKADVVIFLCSFKSEFLLNSNNFVLKNSPIIIFCKAGVAALVFIFQYIFLKMPALEAFGRRWHVGSDDFVLPGICDLIIRISWFIATAVVYWRNHTGLESGCSGGELIKYFLYGIFAAILLIIFADIALVHNSKAGSIMETSARKFVPLCLYIRTFLLVLELAWNSVGTYWYCQDILTCPEAPDVEVLVHGLIICNWLLTLFTFILFLVMFDSLGAHRYNVSENVVADPKLAKCWSMRWRFLCFYWWTRNKDIETTFRELGTYLAAAFETADIVFSDILCGFILLFLKNREVRKKSHLDQISISSRSTTTSSIDSHLPPGLQLIEWPKTEEWNSLPMINHYYQYAVACYSWGVVLCTSPHPLCALWKDTFCCGCLRKNPFPFQIEDDNCCFLNSGSARDTIRIDNSELVFCSFHDTVYRTPFLVALDHGEKSIVIAIRGTMSRADVVTDIYVRPVSLSPWGYPENYRVHQGMLMNALKVHEKLTELQLVSRLLQNHPGYKIVTTGTSLGSASATLLSLILRKEHPSVDVKCFAYSPSGALMNIETAKYCEAFVTSVIYGDDFVARLAVKSIERLKYDIIAILRECRTPKYKILLGGLLGLCGIRPKVSFYPDLDVRKESRQELISSYGFDYAQINVVPIEGEKSPFYLVSSPSDHKMRMKEALKQKCEKVGYSYPPLPCPAKLLPFELMYPPGKLLHITETAAFRSGRRCKKGEISAPRWNIRWAERNEFREIIVARRMIMDHVPFRPNKALKDLTRRWLQSQNPCLASAYSLSHSNPQLGNMIIDQEKCLKVGLPTTELVVPMPIVDDFILSPISIISQSTAEHNTTNSSSNSKS